MKQDLSIIQKTYDLIAWYVPILNRLPRDHKMLLGQRIITELYNLLESFVALKYARKKRTQLQNLNNRLDILRYQARLLYDFQLISAQRYEYVSLQLNGIGRELGGWLKQQRRLANSQISIPGVPKLVFGNPAQSGSRTLSSRSVKDKL